MLDFFRDFFFHFCYYFFVFCGLLKSFFRDIKNGLISKALLVKFTNITTCDLLQREIQIYNTVFRVLPVQNQNLLKILILHLRKIIKADNNGMNVENVSKIFAPTLINILSELDQTRRRTVLDSMKVTLQCSEHATSMVKAFLNNNFIE